MNIVKLMMVVIILSGASAVMADNATPEWEEAIKWPEAQQICFQLDAVRSNPTDKVKATAFADRLFALLGKPSDPLREVTCGRGEGQTEFFFGTKIVEEMIEAIREAELTPANTKAQSSAKIREALRLDIAEQLKILRGNDAREAELEVLIQQSAEYRFKSTDVGLTEAEAAKILTVP